MTPETQIVVKFPSGRTAIIDQRPPVPLDRNQPTTPTIERRAANKPQACKYIGAARTEISGCSASVASTLWNCTLDRPELTGVCAPLAVLAIDPSVVACRSCKYWEPAASPGYTKLAANFVTAAARWIAAGQPVRSQSRVDELLAICEACPYLAGRGTDRQHCGKCGCPVNGRVDEPTKNKLAMATERCPLDPPRWEAEA